LPRLQPPTNGRPLGVPDDFRFYFAYTVGLMSMHFTQQGAARRVNEHRICMNFMFRNGWHISFLEATAALPCR
jgi:hypothetical protein